MPKPNPPSLWVRALEREDAPSSSWPGRRCLLIFPLAPASPGPDTGPQQLPSKGSGERPALTQGHHVLLDLAHQGTFLSRLPQCAHLTVRRCACGRCSVSSSHHHGLYLLPLCAVTVTPEAQEERLWEAMQSPISKRRQSFKRRHVSEWTFRSHQHGDP